MKEIDDMLLGMVKEAVKKLEDNKGTIFREVDMTDIFKGDKIKIQTIDKDGNTVTR